MSLRQLITLGTSLVFACCLNVRAFAHDKVEGKPATAEARKKMAEAHRKVAECLESDKPMKECHEQMHQIMEHACKDGDCPMHKPHHGKKDKAGTEKGDDAANK